MTKDLLGPGVYTLLRSGRPVFIGRARCLLTVLAAHRNHVGEPVPSWHPCPGVVFDDFTFSPGMITRAELDRLRTELEVPRARAA